MFPQSRLMCCKKTVDLLVMNRLVKECKMVKSTNAGSLKPLLMILILLNVLAFWGCGGSIDKTTSGSGSGGGTVTPPVIAAPASIKVSADTTSVKSDDSSTATIIATVLDASNAVIKDLTVTFSTTGGKLSAASAVSDDKGQAKITFSSGTIDQTNRVVMITGVAGSLSSQIPVTITGSTITLGNEYFMMLSGSKLLPFMPTPL